MKHLWAHCLRFSKNQIKGPFEDHVWAIKTIFWTFLGKRITGYIQQCEIWHGATLGTLIKIQEDPMCRTMLGPCVCHRRIIFWPFQGVLATGYTQKGKIWNEVSLIILIKIEEEEIFRTL